VAIGSLMDCLNSRDKLINKDNHHGYLPWHKKIGFLTFSFIYAYILQSFPLMEFKDRVSYIKYAADSDRLIEGYLSHGIVKLIANEPVWLMINASLAHLLTPEAIVRLIIFTAAFITSYVLLKSSPKNAGWIMVFLISPQILLKYTLHLRQGLAIAIFLLGYFSQGGLRRYLLMISSGFIHSSFFFIFPFLLIPYFAKKLRLALDVRIAVIILVSIALILAIGFIAGILGARQASLLGEVNVSGLGFIFWLGIACLFILEGGRYLREHQLAFSILIFYLFTYFSLVFSARIFESGLSLVLLAGLLLTGWRRQAFIVGYLLMMVFLWLTQYGTILPMLVSR